MRYSEVRRISCLVGLLCLVIMGLAACDEVEGDELKIGDRSYRAVPSATVWNEKLLGDRLASNGGDREAYSLLTYPALEYVAVSHEGGYALYVEQSMSSQGLVADWMSIPERLMQISVYRQGDSQSKPSHVRDIEGEQAVSFQAQVMRDAAEVSTTTGEIHEVYKLVYRMSDGIELHERVRSIGDLYVFEHQRKQLGHQIFNDYILDTEQPDEGSVEQKPLSELLRELSINQQDERQSGGLVDFASGRMPTGPVQYGLHLDEVYIFMSLPETVDDGFELLTSSLEVEGDVSFMLEEAGSEGRYRLGISGIKDRFSFTLGDVGPVTVRRMEPVEVHITTPESGGPYLHLPSEHDLPQYVYVTQETTSFDMVFSEPMIQLTNLAESTGEPWGAKGLTGAWVDDQTYRFELPEPTEGPSAEQRIQLDFHHLYSEQGNHLRWGAPSHFEIRIVPSREWLNFETGTSVEASVRDPFYDFLLYSPDGSRYVGGIQLEHGFGDGTGYYYAFVLEQSGEAPIVVESEFYTSILHQGLPIQWMGNDQLLYANYGQVLRYDAVTGTRESLYQTSEEGYTAVNQVVYDPYADDWTMLVQRRDESMEWLSDMIPGYVIDRYVHKGSTLVSEEQGVTAAVLQNKYELDHLEIHPTVDGVYHTVVKERMKHTRYIGRDDSQVTIPGEVMLVTAGGEEVILQTRRPDGEQGQVPWSFSRWSPGEEPVALPAPPEGVRDIEMFGDRLIAWDEERDVTYAFSLSSGRWDVLEADAYDVYYPRQAVASFYRRSSSSLY